MLDKMLSKKGVSPLIAVVLLVAIVVGLGAVLMTFTRNYFTVQEEQVDLKTEQMKCASDMSIELLAFPATGLKVRCDSEHNNVYQVNVQAGPSLDIEGFKLTGIGDSTSTFTVDTVMARGDAGIIEGNFTEEISTLRVVPMLKIADQPEPYPCIEAAQEVTVEVDCSTGSS